MTSAECSTASALNQASVSRTFMVMATLPTLIDSHAHLFREDFGEEVDAVLDRARLAGIVAIVVPGTNLETSEEAVALSEKHHDVFACVGFHPHEASKSDAGSLRKIEELSHHPKVVAIGEIGLDFHYDFSPRPDQRRVFRTQLELAMARQLPVVVHTRESIRESIDMVREQGGETGSLRGVFHCFTGTPSEAEELFRMGFLISAGGMVTFKNSPTTTLIRALSLANVIAETDTPYLAPVPLRGSRNEPGFLVHIIRKMAELCDLTTEAAAELTSANARRLFRIEAAFAGMMHKEG